MADNYDMVVIGSGPGGYVAAIRAAQVGMKTAVVERAPMLGGRCLNEACIPAKAMLRAADVLGEVRDGAEFGISAKGLEFDIAGAAAHRDKVVKTLTGGVAGLMKKNKIDVLEGTASLAGQGPRGGGRQGASRREKIVLATGSVSLPDPRHQLRRPRAGHGAACGC